MLASGLSRLGVAPQAAICLTRSSVMPWCRSIRSENKRASLCELNVMPAALLVQRHTVVHQRHEGSVLGGLAEHEVGSQHMATARHVLRDYGRPAENVFRQIFRDPCG